MSQRSRLLAMMILCAAPAHADDWRQWGGPSRDFRVATARVADSWPESGPRRLWERELGEGYSAIVSKDGLLFTMYRTGDQEHIVCLSAESGETRWTRSYDAPPLPKSELGFGKGPNATPLIEGDRLIAVGFTGKMHCLNARDGKVLWQTDLFADHGATFLQFGYSSSPLLVGDCVLIPLGAKDRALAAFSLADGKIRWSAGDFENSYSTPILVNIGGKPQITLVTTTAIVGLSADRGETLWTHPYKNQWDTHCTTPVDCGDGRIFYPSFEGGVMLRVHPDGRKVEELWTTKKIGVGQTNVICSDGVLFGASGGGKSGFYAALKASDGTQLWRERLPIANTLLAGNRLIVLDESGTLHLLRPSTEKFDEVGKVSILDGKCWTVPTFVDGRLFLRDQRRISAIDVSPPGGK